MDVITFGEAMIRLAPPNHRRLEQAYSLDLEIGFIDGPEDVIELERELLTFVFARLNERHAGLLARNRRPRLPSLDSAPVWEFGECLDRLRHAHGTKHLRDDLDPEAERRLCALAVTLRTRFTATESASICPAESYALAVTVCVP